MCAEKNDRDRHASVDERAAAHLSLEGSHDPTRRSLSENTQTLKNVHIYSLVNVESIVSQIRNDFDDDDDEFVTMRSENYFLVMKNPTQKRFMLLLFMLEWSTSSLRLHMEETKRKHEKKIIFLASFANVATDECGDLLATASDKFNFNLHTQTHTILNIEQFRIVSRYFFLVNASLLYSRTIVIELFVHIQIHNLHNTIEHWREKFEREQRKEWKISIQKKK